MPRISSLLLLVLALGCRETRVEISVLIPDATGTVAPAAGVTVAALPFDRDSLFTAFENEAPTPRPHTAELDDLFHRFRVPFAESTRLAALISRLRATIREAEATGGASVAALRDSLATLERRHAEADARLATARREVGPRIDSLRAEIRIWEQQAFQNWSEAVRSLTSGSLTTGISDTTRHDGTVVLYLSPGSRRWWIYARSFNSGDPHSEWYWNLPVTGPTMTLDTATGRLRPRY